MDPGKDAGSLMQSVFLAKVSDASAGPRRHVGDLLGRKRLILVVKKNHCLALAGLKKVKSGSRTGVRLVRARSRYTPPAAQCLLSALAERVPDGGI